MPVKFVVLLLALLLNIILPVPKTLSVVFQQLYYKVRTVNRRYHSKFIMLTIHLQIRVTYQYIKIPRMRFVKKSFHSSKDFSIVTSLFDNNAEDRLHFAINASQT